MNPPRIEFMKNNIELFLESLSASPELIEFSDTMSIIDEYYDFTESAFTNGETNNAAGENSASCKLLAFAQEQNLSKEQTLACFGHYYREEVLKNSHAVDHQNIRQFMINGFSGLVFFENPLKLKQKVK